MDDSQSVHKPNLKTRAQSYYEKNEVYFSIGFFLGGFAFDLLMIKEIDDVFSIVQQVFYLTFVGVFLCLDALKAFDKIQIPNWAAKFWEYRMALIHFMLGTLLNIYSIFYFKSSSLISSFVFLIVICVVLIANENHHVKKFGLWPKFVIYTLCLNAFFSMMLPVILGFIGWVPFILSVVCTSLVLFVIAKKIWGHGLDKSFFRKQILIPTLGVEVIFVLFYLLGWIPPVPLSARFMGIYHNVEKKDGHFLLSHQRPWWKVWQTGDQVFYARPNDAIYFFSNVYSPAKFSDELKIHWMYKDPKFGWTGSDLIPMKISGGRAEGFRGFTKKSNYVAGEWRVQIETTDGREIGRTYFEVIDDLSQNERAYQIDEK